MKKAVIISVFILLITGVFVQPEYSHAVDTSPPVIKSLVFRNADNVQEGGYLEVEADVEDTSGVSWIRLVFLNDDGHDLDIIAKSESGTVYSGKQIFKGKVSRSKNGTYRLTWIFIEDTIGNSVEFDNAEAPIDYLVANREITITGASETGGETSSPKIVSAIVRNPEAVDAKGYLTADIEVKNGKVRDGWMSFEDTTGRVTNLAFGFREPKTGKITVKLPIKNRMANGKHILKTVWLTNWIGVKNTVACYTPEKDRYHYADSDPIEWLADGVITKEINVVNSTADVIAPVINSVTIPATDLVLPTVFKVRVDVTEEDTGISDFYLYFKNEKGHEIFAPNYRPTEINDKRTGEYTLKIPFSPFMGEGVYTLEHISIADGNGNEHTYYRDSELNEICSCREVTLRSPFVVSYEGVLENVNGILNAAETMKEGEFAVIDARRSTVIPKAVFESIAGKDITLVFTTEDVEWIFNGKDIIKSRCKDIDIATSFSLLKGKVWGFADDKKVLAIYFGNNGKLPGKARIRINNEYFCQVRGRKQASGTDICF